jgi:hypothetical protein
MSKYNKAHYEANKLQIRARQKKYEDSHKKERKAYLQTTRPKRLVTMGLYYINHKDKLLEDGREYNRTHKKERKDYLQLNKVEKSAKHKIYRQQNKEKLDAYNKEYSETHKVQELERTAKYREGNRGKIGEYRMNHVDYKRVAHTKHMLQVKTEVLTHYGKDGKLSCMICGYNKNVDGLELDHINGHGTKHRRELKGATIYIWLKRNDYPEGFQTLCGTCHRIKSINDTRWKVAHRQLQVVVPTCKELMVVT